MIFTGNQLPPQTNTIIWIILAVLLIGFALIGLLGWLVEKYMAWAQLRVDQGMSPLILGRSITKPDHFQKIAFKKHHRLAFTEFFYPSLILVIAFIFLYGFMAIMNDPQLINELWNYVPNQDGYARGFNTLFFIWDWENISTANFFGLTIWNDFPTLLNSPHFYIEAWPSYVYISLLIMAGFLYTLSTLSLFARTFRIYAMKNTAFTIRLEEVSKKMY